MPRSHKALVFAILTVALSTELMAMPHFTDVGGKEISLNRGPRLPKKVVASNSKRPVTHSTVTINAGPDTDAANNDYRRIQNAINAAASGDTIVLSGTFDFTQPFAAAAWASGDDGTAATADDYAVHIPGGKSNITITATSLGSATIQGPGDLAAVNLESCLFFDGGVSQGWTISNLRILDFDLSIGMFANAAGDFNGTHIQNNFIRVPTDLNATVAPADVNQNIGIHFSFGTNQVISGNTFNIPGDGVTSGANTSADVAMQSNAGVVNTYDGLSISNNTIHVLNAQSANPETIIGIWENGSAHTSNISVSGNAFINDAAGNDPSLNVQRAFRVTSHSSTTTTVTYASDQVTGANIGIQWLTGANFSGNQPVLMTTDTLTNCATGILVQSNGLAHVEQNVITGSGAGGGIHVVTGNLSASGANPDGVFQSYVSGGSGDGIWIEAVAGVIAPMAQNDLSGNAGFGLRNESPLPDVAEVNWWGSNLAVNVAAEVNGNADFDPWLASGTDVAPATTGFQPFVFATTSGALTTFAGTAGADTGALLATSPLTLQMNGQSATIPVAEALSFDVQLGGSDDLFTLGQTGVPTTFDGGAGNDTLVGTNVAQTWNITGPGSGNIPGATSAFASIEALRGGTAADSFVFGAAGSIAQTVDGNLGIDTLDNSAIPGHTVTPTGPGTLDGFMGTATGIVAGFDNINIIAGAPADLSVVKSGPTTANAGSVVSYTITVTNAGPNPAINPTLTDAIPAGATFASLTAPGGWSCTTPAVGGTGTVNCSTPSMAVGAATFTLNVNAPAAPASISNTASVSSSSTDPNPANNSSTTGTNVVFLADLAVMKTATATAAAGSNVTYDITVTNNGPSQATTVSLTDVLPPNTTFVSESQPTGPAFACTNPGAGNNGTVTCTIASLPALAVATFQIVVQTAVATPVGPLVNTATVSTTSTDTVVPNNISAATTAITAATADLAITKSGPATAATGGQITYNIAVSNSGPNAATVITLTDVLPAGVTFGSASPSQGSCSGTTTVTCSLGTLANGGAAAIVLVVNVTAASGTIANTATVSANEADPNPANGTSTTTATVSGSVPTLSIWALIFLAGVLGLLALTRLRIS
jgi:uncharacterized repeat protein (TIGR01451 family)